MLSPITAGSFTAAVAAATAETTTSQLATPNARCLTRMFDISHDRRKNGTVPSGAEGDRSMFSVNAWLANATPSGRGHHA